MGKLGQAKVAKTPKTVIKTITTKGTPEALVADYLFVKMAVVQALEDNTGNILLGDSNIDYTTGQGAELAPTNSVTLEGVNLADWYADVDVDGEGLSITYEEAL